MAKPARDLFPHEDTDAFRAALEHTGASSGFSPLLIEKDYFCSLVLSTIYDSGDKNLVFKGGTSLNKVHVGFYRLSEDLDFSISVPEEATRSQRSESARPFKRVIDALSKKIPDLNLATSLTGANASSQYTARLEYKSCFSHLPGGILLDIGLREPVLTRPISGKASTLLLDPFRNEPAFPEFEVICLSREEAYSEKVRAALTRREPAIRDVFDIYHGLIAKAFNPKDSGFIHLVSQKLKIKNNDPIDVSQLRMTAMRTQLETQLRPVLRPKDFESFDFGEAWKNVEMIARLIQK